MEQPTKAEIAFIQKVVKCPKCRRAMRVVTLDGKPGFFCTWCQEPHEELPERPQICPSATDTASYLPGVFLSHWPENAPQPKPEYKFAPGRKCAFDLAFIDQKLAVECEGNQHRTKDRFFADIEKYNLATLLGWRVLRASSSMLRDQPQAFVDMVRQALDAGSGG